MQCVLKLIEKNLEFRRVWISFVRWEPLAVKTEFNNDKK